MIDWLKNESIMPPCLKKVLSVNPDVIKYGVKYEQILRDEYFKFVKTYPLFFIQTLFAKFGVCLMYLLFFTNIGLLLAVYYPQGYLYNFLFASGIGFNMLFGLLATPEYQYFLGNDNYPWISQMVCDEQSYQNYLFLHSLIN